MKLTVLTTTFLSIAISASSQVPNSDALKKELAGCKVDNENLQKENVYLKKSLNILKPIKIIEQDGIDFNLLKAEGNIKEQTLALTFSITNHKANSDFQFKSAQAIDIQGNDFHSDEIYIGKQRYRNKLFTDTSVQTIVNFKQVLPSIKI